MGIYEQKYRNQKVSHKGRSFASKLEAAVYDLLVQRELAGEISDIQQQDTVYLTEARIRYMPDFKFFDKARGEHGWAEAKGLETPIWRLKRKLWPHYGPGRLEVYKGRANSIVLHEVLISKTIKDEEE